MGDAAAGGTGGAVSADDASAASDTRYRFLYNHTPVMMKAVDVESRIIDANDYYLRNLGYARDDVIGRRSTDFVTEASAARIARALPPDLLADGELRSVECQLVRKDGGLIDAEVFAVAEMDGEGRVRQVLSFFIDRRDRRRAERLAVEKTYLEEALQDAGNFGEIVGASPAMRKVFAEIEMVAGTDAAVLLLGETGTGKELFARSVHDRSARSGHTMIKVNCGALPANLVESELFGHEKGAFTGATARRKGRFEMADRGTLFLDEVGELPLDTQTKLLRVLQEQAFERIGASETLRVDVRVIAATNRDLEAAVADGSFRADLYYRLSVFPVRVPALRERREDIPLLADCFVRKFARRMGRPVHGIDEAALRLLQRWDWPGNVRELANIIERAVILCQGATLGLNHIRGLDTAAGNPEPFPSLKEAERRHILAALERTEGVVAGPNGAARLLGLPRSTLWARMQKLGIGAR